MYYVLGAYQFKDLENRYTVYYKASWEFGRSVGKTPKLHLVTGCSACCNAAQIAVSAEVNPHTVQSPANPAVAQRVGSPAV